MLTPRPAAEGGPGPQEGGRDDAMDRTGQTTPPGRPVARRRAMLAGAAAALGLPVTGGPGARAQPRPPTAAAADWPTQPVRYINLYAPGGATDIASRVWCQAMTALTGQQFVVENRAGAGGTVGTTAIARSPADGTTIGLGSVATLAIAPSLYPSLPYDAARDFTFISGLWRQPNLLMVGNDVPARTVPELIALLKVNPGRYAYATGGAGTTPHLTGELFKTMAGVEMTHVSYRGGAPALVDVIAGRVPVLFDNFSGPIGAVREGKLRGLAVTGPERSPAAPDLPTLAEFLPGFDVTSWNGVVAPAGLPPEMVRRMNALARRALESPEVVRNYTESGATTWPTTPEEYAEYRARQEVLMARLVRQSGARVE
jgi:tripartite-type tricarboxylate transporter receptor subunit TctC